MLYIEDNPPDIALVESVLEELGPIALVTAHTAELGVALVRAHRPDVVIMDIDLPGASGIAAAQQLRESAETRAIPIVALSAVTASPAERAVFDRFLAKPLRVEALTEALALLFDGAPARTDAR